LQIQIKYFTNPQSKTSPQTKAAIGATIRAAGATTKAVIGATTIRAAGEMTREKIIGAERTMVEIGIREEMEAGIRGMMADGTKEMEEKVTTIKVMTAGEKMEEKEMTEDGAVKILGRIIKEMEAGAEKTISGRIKVMDLGRILEKVMDLERVKILAERMAVKAGVKMEGRILEKEERITMPRMWRICFAV
jgi:hypothetical protein